MAINECLGYQLDFFGQPEPAPAIQAKLESVTTSKEAIERLTMVSPESAAADPVTTPSPHSRKPEINLQKIEAELQQDAGELTVKVVKSNGNAARVSIRETDKGVHIRINPKCIRTQAHLDGVMEYCRSSINWDNQV